MLGIIVAIIVLVIAIIILCSMNKEQQNDYSTTDTSDESKSFNINNSYVEKQTFAIPGEIVEPVSVKRTLLNSTSEQKGIVSVQLNTYNVKERFNDLLPFNYRRSHKYKIKGKNSATNRQKTLSIVAFDEDDLKKRAIEKGLVEPFSIDLCDTPPTEKQKEFLRDLGLSVKPEYTSEDVSCIISRTYEHEPAAEDWLLTFSVGHNIPFSLYATNDNILYHIHKEYFTDTVKEISFWVYCVNRFANNSDYFNGGKFEDIAKQLSEDQNFMRLYKRNQSEGKINYIKPNTRTLIYKTTLEKLKT